MSSRCVGVGVCFCQCVFLQVCISFVYMYITILCEYIVNCEWDLNVPVNVYAKNTGQECVWMEKYGCICHRNSAAGVNTDYRQIKHVQTPLNSMKHTARLLPLP